MAFQKNCCSLGPGILSAMDKAVATPYLSLSDIAKALGAKGGANSRKNQPDGGRSLGQKAAGSRWARFHAEKKRADKRYVVPEKYREAVAALLKGK